MKFFSVIGTRPNFVKEFLIHRECKRRGIEEILIHTGQHYDYELSQIFFEVFDLPEPDHYLAVNNVTGAQFSADVILRLNELLREERPDFVLGYGDVNSTLSAAIAAAKNRIPFAHIEGGVRGGDLYNPEEINRRVSDVLAEVIYCCTKNDVKNLEKENFEKHRIVLTGDLMKDALEYTINKYNIQPSYGEYMVLTLHRQENVTNKRRLEIILDGLIMSNERIIFPAHPRTIHQIKCSGLDKKLSESKIEIRKPMGYLDFIRLIAGAKKIITDSGGVRREAYLLKKPCIVLIELSWFPEISDAGWKVLTGPDAIRISRLIKEFEPAKEHPNIFGDGKAHVKIVNDLEERFGKK